MRRCHSPKRSPALGSGAGRRRANRLTSCRWLPKKRKAFGGLAAAQEPERTCEPASNGTVGIGRSGNARYLFPISSDGGRMCESAFHRHAAGPNRRLPQTRKSAFRFKEESRSGGKRFDLMVSFSLPGPTGRPSCRQTGTIGRESFERGMQRQGCRGRDIQPPASGRKETVRGETFRARRVAAVTPVD